MLRKRFSPSPSANNGSIKSFRARRRKNTEFQSRYKSFIPHFMCIEDKIVNQLINDGFKVSKGEWMRCDNGLIIEW